MSSTAIELLRRTTISVGDYRKELQGTGTFWRGAADDLAKQVPSFVKDNRERILAVRDKK